MAATYCGTATRCFIDPVGGLNEPERARAYYRLIPPWRYLRYERAAPAFLQCLRPGDRGLANPFYYLRGRARQDESFMLNRVLIGRMVRSGSQVVLLYSNELIAPSSHIGYSSAALERLAADFPGHVMLAGLSIPRSFPYRTDDTITAALRPN